MANGRKKALFPVYIEMTGRRPICFPDMNPLVPSRRTVSFCRYSPASVPHDMLYLRVQFIAERAQDLTPCIS